MNFRIKCHSSQIAATDPTKNMPHRSRVLPSHRAPESPPCMSEGAENMPADSLKALHAPQPLLLPFTTKMLSASVGVDELINESRLAKRSANAF
jgi:hypothetical protein